MLLYPGEVLIESFREGTILLTDRRVAREVHGWRHSYIEDMPLESIRSVEYHRIKQSLLLMFAGICILIGLAATLLDRPWALGPTILIALILLAVYSNTKANYIQITGEEKKLRIEVSAWQKEEIDVFINKIRLAREQRALNLTQNLGEG